MQAVAHAGGVTHRNGMRAPGKDQGTPGCLPTVAIGVTACKLAPCSHNFTTDAGTVQLSVSRPSTGAGRRVASENKYFSRRLTTYTFQGYKFSVCRSIEQR